MMELSSTTTTATNSKEQMQGEFRAGVTAALRSWSALRTAMDSEWGGANSQEKAEILRQSIYEHLDGTTYPPKMDQVDLEDALAIYMEEEFSITLEDDSEKQVADVLLRMYHDCFSDKRDPTLCRQVVESAAQASKAVGSYPVKVQTSEHDDDDDDDEMEDAEQNLERSLHAQTYAAESLFGGSIEQKSQVAPPPPSRQLGEARVEKAAPELDGDGFAAVSTKKKKKQQV